ncbi:MAG: T9SS type A sorting domain-containing protein [Saprospiraceae bacterium]|nr:T9SS type A sorting domain-containing protein [Saprospiraceae bacterium]
MYLRIILSVILFLKVITLFSQSLDFFSVLPRIGAVNGESVFNGIAADSSYIYVMGSMVTKVDTITRRRNAGYMSWVFDYSGRLISENMMYDSSLEKIVKWGDVFSLHRNKSGVYDFNFYDPTTTTNPKGFQRIGRVDMHSGKILKQGKIPVPYPDTNDLVNAIMNEITWVRDTLVSTLLVSGSRFEEPYIFEMDSNFNSIKLIKLHETRPDTNENPCWITKDNKGNYEVIYNVVYRKNFIPTGFVALVYKKYDSNGKLIKSKRLDTQGKNIFINGAFYYNVKRDDLGNFMIFACDVDPVTVEILVPIALYISPEFDTLYKLQPMYQYPKLSKQNLDHWTYYLDMLGDDRGYVASSTVSNNSSPYEAYGALYKISAKGDSLWHRIYQPLNWDSTRAGWIKFTQVKETPYQSLVVSAMVSDRSDYLVKSWLLHLDSEGCLIPGCEKVVSNTDIHSVKAKAFNIYPNPIVSNHLYLLSNISGPSKFNIEIKDLFGRTLHTSFFNPLQGVQYIMELPDNFSNGEYIFQIQGKEYSQVEKITLLR